LFILQLEALFFSPQLTGNMEKQKDNDSIVCSVRSSDDKNMNRTLEGVMGSVPGIMRKYMVRRFVIKLTWIRKI
jgi:hypothetical protein